jgi:hypothetical protein
MRKRFCQPRLDCQPIIEVELNLRCRHELVPILAGLQHLYGQPALRDEILALIAGDVNQDSREDCGRRGLDHWHILVLAGARLGCGLDYDQLQDLAENHRHLRYIMGLGDWEEGPSMSWRCIRDNLCQLRPQTIMQIELLIVQQGHRLVPEAVEQVRVDSFVVETNIHYPTESSLIQDGLRKVIGISERLATADSLSGWRQAAHLLKKGKALNHKISRIVAKKGGQYKTRLQKEYRKLLDHSGKVLRKARALIEQVLSLSPELATLEQLEQLRMYLSRTEQVRGTARRRVLKGEQVENAEKLFSIFEAHTQLYRRGKAGQPNQYGRLVLVCEDAGGFIVHHALLPRDVQDVDVAVDQTRKLQQRLGHRVKQISFDRGFHSPSNQEQLSGLVEHVCLPKPGAKQSVVQEAEASAEFFASRQRHPGVESAVGALQRGNDLERCRDRGELGFERYVALGVLGRNLHVLGKHVIAQHDASCAAATRQRGQRR